MRAATFQVSTQIEFFTEECANCGVAFAITMAMQKQLRENRNTFYCPNGHPQSYTLNESARLRLELAAKARALQWEKERTASLDKQLTKERKSSARLKKRVSQGVCPCCQRTVSQFARHMQSKHPDFVKEAAGLPPEAPHR